MKRTWPIGLGKVVRSKNGRDEGREFIVTALEGDFAYVADGDTRKIEKPKKKRAPARIAASAIASLPFIRVKAMICPP